MGSNRKQITWTGLNSQTPFLDKMQLSIRDPLSKNGMYDIACSKSCKYLESKLGVVIHNRKAAFPYVVITSGNNLFKWDCSYSILRTSASIEYFNEQYSASCKVTNFSDKRFQCQMMLGNNWLETYIRYSTERNVMVLET